MAIATFCPHCRATYRLADDQAGKRVRCRGCQQTFDVPGGPPAPAPHVGVHRLGKALKVPPPAPPALPSPPALPTALPATAPPPRRARGPDDDAEPPRDDLPLPPANDQAVLWVALALGGVAVVVMLGCGGLIWYSFVQAGKRVDRIIQQAQQGQPPVPFPAPAEQPIVNQLEAMGALSSPDPRRRQRGAEWLGRQPPDRDPTRRAQVRDALEPLLEDPDFQVRHAARHARAVWRDW